MSTRGHQRPQQQQQPAQNDLFGSTPFLPPPPQSSKLHNTLQACFLRISKRNTLNLHIGLTLQKLHITGHFKGGRVDEFTKPFKHYCFWWNIKNQSWTNSSISSLHNLATLHFLHSNKWHLVIRVRCRVRHLCLQRPTSRTLLWPPATDTLLLTAFTILS